MSYLKSLINPELPLTNSTEETTFDKNETALGKSKRTAWNHDMGKKTAMTDECQERLDSITVKEYSTDDLAVFLNRKTAPTPKLLSWTTEEKEALPLVRSQRHRGDRVLLLVLCLMCAAALGLSLLMLFGVLRPHCPPDTKKGSKCSTSNSNQITGLKNDETTVWRAIERNREDIIQLNQTKDEITVWRAIERIREEIIQLNQTNDETSVWRAIERIREGIIQINQTMANISKQEGPRGPPGYNGTRGRPVDSGPPGPPGINGTQSTPDSSPTGGDLTLCSYQEKKGTEVTSDNFASTDVSVNEPNGKKIIGANCVSNDAKVVLLSSSDSGGTRKYQCDCSGTLNTGVSKMYCSIHYWEC